MSQFFQIVESGLEKEAGESEERIVPTQKPVLENTSSKS